MEVNDRVQGNDLVEVNGQVRGKNRRAGDQAQGGDRQAAAAMPLGIFRQAKLLARSPRVATQALAAVAAAVLE